MMPINKVLERLQYTIRILVYAVSVSDDRLVNSIMLNCGIDSDYMGNTYIQTKKN